MNTVITGFEHSASQVARLTKFQDLFDSCGQLMADTLVNEGKIFSLGSGLPAVTAEQFSSLLINNSDEPRPALPTMFIADNSLSTAHLQMFGNEGDFAILFGGSDSNTRLNTWLDTCLEKSLTSILINPDLDQIETTDKALEIRLEYRSETDYLVSLSAVSSYLIKSIEKQLFGRQA